MTSEPTPVCQRCGVELKDDEEYICNVCYGELKQEEDDYYDSQASSVVVICHINSSLKTNEEK